MKAIKKEVKAQLYHSLQREKTDKQTNLPVKSTPKWLLLLSSDTEILALMNADSREISRF